MGRGQLPSQDLRSSAESMTRRALPCTIGRGRQLEAELVMERLQEVTGLDAAVLARLAWTLLWVALVFGLRSALLVWLKRRAADPVLRFRVRRISGYVATSLTLLVVGALWLHGFESIATFAGLASAGIAIALKDVMASAAGWVFILWRRPFELGDRIEIDGVRGDVVDISLLQHSLMEIGNWVAGDDRTGRVLHVPNARVLSSIVANYTKGWFQHIWDELSVVITFESDWQEARRLLQGIVGANSPEAEQTAALRPGATAYLVMDASTQPTVFLRVQEHGIQLTARYVCDPRKRGAMRQQIWEDVLKAFAQHEEIDFAYPTQRFFDSTAESKAARRAAKR
jgi:small-conductance mechanosensitive channel